MTQPSTRGRWGKRRDELPHFSPGQAVQLMATNSPRSVLPPLIREKVSRVHAMRVGVRNGGCGSSAARVLEVNPSPAQIAAQGLRGGPFCCSRLRTRKPRNAETRTEPAANDQPIRRHGLSALKGPLLRVISAPVRERIG